MSKAVVFFRCRGAEDLPDRAALKQAAGDVVLRFWKPGDAGGPEGFSLGRSALVYRIFSRLGVFSTRDYGALCIEDQSGNLLHASSIFPRFFRFPFMGSDDLQIGSTYTAPHARGRKLATLALTEIVAVLDKPGRQFWYLTEDTNAASVGVARASGFALAGSGAKVARFGLLTLGAYQLTEPAYDHELRPQ